MTQHKILGIIAATFTSMHKNGSINPGPDGEYSRYLIDSKLSRAYINGTTGDGIMMTTRERK